MLTKLYANHLVPEVVGVPGQGASHDCPEDVPPGGAPGNPPDGSGSGGGCAHVILVCVSTIDGPPACLPFCAP